ncbi:MAG: undecaprenyl-phosphate glucose phosphotransferase [bacterium]
MNNQVINRPVVATVAPLLDGGIVALSGWVSYWLRWNDWIMGADYLMVLLLASALTLVVFPISGAYQSWRGKWQLDEFGHTLVGLVAVSLILVLLGALTKTTADYSRLWMSYWFLLAFVALFGSRFIYALMMRKVAGRAASSRSILIIGTGELAGKVANKLTEEYPDTIDLSGFVSTGAEQSHDKLPANILGSLDVLPDLLERLENQPDEVWIAVAAEEQKALADIVRTLQHQCALVRYVPDLSMLALINHTPGEIAGMTVIDLNASPLTGQNVLVKAVFDRLFAAIVLTLLSPLLLGIAILIKLDSQGSVLFRQQRHGWDGKTINVLKFRTMVDASQQDEGFQQAKRDDKRVTRTGKWLRRTSLDELPQFLNVLRGEMSVVGPRPHPLALNESFKDEINAYMQRHRVKPGITGWAQIHGYRGETDTLDKMQNRVDYDLYYIEHWSLWLDIKIILRTVFSGFVGDNAY